MPVRSLTSSVVVWPDRSDLDVVLVVTSVDLPFARRPAAWDLTRLPVPADALVYTEEKWQRLDPASRFARTLAREVVWAWVKEP